MRSIKSYADIRPLNNPTAAVESVWIYCLRQDQIYEYNIGGKKANYFGSEEKDQYRFHDPLN